MIVRFPRLAALSRRLRRRIASLSQREQGVALVEFALVAPVMITMYLGMVELSIAVGHERKASLISRTLADLTTQASTHTSAQIDAIFSSASAILAPYPVKDISMRITAFRVDQANKVFVDWSDVKDIARSGGSYTVMTRCADGASFIPAPLRIKGTTIVLADTKIKHTPVVGKFVGNIEMTESIPMIPRTSTTVGREGVPTTPCPGESV